MGKNLKGKELGKGLGQREDKKYIARFTDKYGKRHNYINESLLECQKWLAESQYGDEHSDLFNNQRFMSVKDWYEQWISIKEKTIKSTSVDTYRNIWKLYVSPVIGNMLMKDVKLQHCQEIFNRMADADKSKSLIRRVKNAYMNFFTMAVDYEIIDTNYMAKTNVKMGRETEKKVAMTKEEQKKFIECSAGTSYELIYRFLLQTGLRISELVGLQWSDIDIENRSLNIKRQLKVVNNKGWTYLAPKTKTSARQVPLTDEAIAILKQQKAFNKKLKLIPMEWNEIVFLSRRGCPTCSDTIDNDIKRICKNNALKNTSCHIMRHTFATRCIEADMQPKALQEILGHSSIKTTMDLYVNFTQEKKTSEILKVQNALKVI